LNGNSVIKSSTLFRGVKFEISEIVGDKEVCTGKYNDYRFSFIYVPIGLYDLNATINDDRHKIYFIKNDDFKFIVGIMFFDILRNSNKLWWDDQWVTDTTNPILQAFNKAYVYSESMGLYLDFEDIETNV